MRLFLDVSITGLKPIYHRLNLNNHRIKNGNLISMQTNLDIFVTMQDIWFYHIKDKYENVSINNIMILHYDCST